ncbi:MAG: XRE family transcriptional regulator [Bryobacteraceae bacterium]|jgi:predicted XRE-type DNA-binding protein
MRSDIMIALSGYIQDRKLSQASAAKIMGVSQPRIPDLMRGKIGSLTLDTLVNMLASGPQGRPAYQASPKGEKVA